MKAPWWHPAGQPEWVHWLMAVLTLAFLAAPFIFGLWVLRVSRHDGDEDVG